MKHYNIYNCGYLINESTVGAVCMMPRRGAWRCINLAIYTYVYHDQSLTLDINSKLAV